MEFTVKEFSELSNHELYEVLKARSQIFIVEKKMICLDPDGADVSAKHFMLKDDGKLIAYLRGLEDGEWYKLGRIISVTHGLGHGKILMERALRYIKDNNLKKKVYINAQCDAVPFYEKCGFVPVGDEFMEENVRHRRMEQRY